MKNEKKISAFLGPTNTENLFLIQRLTSIDCVVGFPLRLLARENYEFAKNFLPINKVALITGEENNTKKC